MKAVEVPCRCHCRSHMFKGLGTAQFCNKEQRSSLRLSDGGTKDISRIKKGHEFGGATG